MSYVRASLVAEQAGQVVDYILLDRLIVQSEEVVAMLAPEG